MWRLNARLAEPMARTVDAGGKMDVRHPSAGKTFFPSFKSPRRALVLPAVAIFLFGLAVRHPFRGDPFFRLVEFFAFYASGYLFLVYVATFALARRAVAEITGNSLTIHLGPALCLRRRIELNVSEIERVFVAIRKRPTIVVIKMYWSKTHYDQKSIVMSLKGRPEREAITTIRRLAKWHALYQIDCSEKENEIVWPYSEKYRYRHLFEHLKTIGIDVHLDAERKHGEVRKQPLEH